VSGVPPPGAALGNFGFEIPFVNLLGFELEHFADGYATVAYAPAANHVNAFGMTHGGALMTLLDVAIASAARSVQKESGMVTIEMKTSFMQKAQGRLTARGRLMHRSATMAFTEATLYDSSGQPCAHATGTFKYTRNLLPDPPQGTP
jgi:uncharacterized protein (TIGR00369 family)